MDAIKTLRRHRDEVDVIRHEAVRQHAQVEALTLLMENIEVGAVVGGGEEYILAVVAALDDVMRQTGDDDAGDSRHGGSVPHQARMSRNR